MGGRASRGGWWSAALLMACAPNAGGVGTGGANTLGLPDDTGEAMSTSGGDASTSTSEPETTTGVDSGMDPSGPPDATGPVDDGTTTEEPPPATTGMGDALLMISDGPRYDFGDVPNGGQAQHVFTVTNAGDGDALGLDGTVAAPFGFPGGFPGGAGTCASTLDAGASCTVEVVFTPSQIGRHAGQLALAYDGGEATRDVQGGAAGQTDNLLVNPGGEDMGTPPPGWTEGPGDWGAGVWPTETGTYAGAGYLYANEGDNNVDLTARQDVGMGSWAPTIDAAALRISFTSRARAWMASNDQHRVRVHFLDAGGGTLGVYTSDYQSATAWTEYADLRVAPAGTRTIRVELNCRKNSGTVCNAYFDALDLHAVYP